MPPPTGLSREIKESDWKRFKALRELALERFSERVLLEIGRIGGDLGKSHHERYLDIYKLIQKRDKELARAFNDLRRSTAIMQIGLFRSHGLLTDDEFSRFSEDLRHVLEGFPFRP